MRLPAGKEYLWPCYRLVLEGVCTWTEVASKMSIDAVMEMNDFLDAYHKAK